MKNLIWTLTALLLCTTSFADNRGEMAAIEEREVGEYDAVYVSGWYHVTLVEGKEGLITLEGKAGTLENITTEVVNGKLRIEWDKEVNINPFQSMSKVLITVPVEEIEAVRLSGSGSVVSETTLRSDSFETTLSGSGRLDLNVDTSSLTSGISGSGNTVLSGTAKEYEVQVSGSGDVRAFELKADDVTASISGSAKIKVFANNSLTARISGSGDVRYMGPATKIDSKVSGSGSVSKG